MDTEHVGLTLADSLRGIQSALSICRMSPKDSEAHNKALTHLRALMRDVFEHHDPEHKLTVTPPEYYTQAYPLLAQDQN
jgi:hypothetical protein